MDNGYINNKMTENIPTRKNNPGDLKQNGNVATFPTPQEGYTSLLNDLQSKISGKSKTGLNGDSTLEQFSSVYAPSSDNNDVGSYTAKLANQLGIAPNTPIKTLEPKIGKFADAIASNEGYQHQENAQPVSQETQQPTNPSFKDYALGGLGAIGGFVGSHLKPLAADALEGGGALVGGTIGSLIEPGGGSVIGSLAGEQAGSKLASTLGLKSSTTAVSSSNASDSSAATAGILNQENEQSKISQEEQADTARDEQQMKDSANVVQALNQTLQTTPTGKLLASQPQNQEALAYMAQNGYLPDTSSGLNDFATSLEKNAKNRGILSTDVAKILDETGEKASLDEVKKNAYANIEKFADVREQPQQKALIDKELAQYEEHYGKEVSLGELERSKREQGMAKGDWQKDTPSRNGHRALYSAFRDTITNNTKHKDLYNRVMKEETKSFRADKLMKKMNGKKALEHKGILRGSLKAYGKYVGTYLGDKIGGPIGAIVGTIVGDHLTHAVDKRFGKTFFESKEGKKLMDIVSERSPKMAKILKVELVKVGIQAEEMKKKSESEKEDRIKKGLLLPEPAIRLGGKSEEAKKSEENRKDVKRKNYTEKKKGILNNHDEHTKNPYMNLEDFGEKLKTINFGKSATPKKKKSEKGLVTIH